MPYFLQYATWHVILFTIMSATWWKTRGPAVLWSRQFPGLDYSAEFCWRWPPHQHQQSPLWRHSNSALWLAGSVYIGNHQAAEPVTTRNTADTRSSACSHWIEQTTYFNIAVFRRDISHRQHTAKVSGNKRSLFEFCVVIPSLPFKRLDPRGRS